MRVGTSRDQLLLELDTARARVSEAISGLTEEQASRPAVDGWSVKDNLNHLTACDEFRFYEISRVSRGGRPAFPSIDREQDEALNALIVTQRRGLPMAQVIADLEFARSLVLQAVAGAPEHALSTAVYGEFAINGSISHDIEHATAILAWRQREGI
jgi:hypothetical protein